MQRVGDILTGDNTGTFKTRSFKARRLEQMIQWAHRNREFKSGLNTEWSLILLTSNCDYLTRMADNK